MKAVSDRLVFITTVDEGSITRAADRLGLSLAVASKRLAKLEQRLGVRLLNRTTRRQHLTDEGRVYYQHCLRIQEEIDTIESSLAGMRESVQGTLRVSASASFGRKHISPVVSEFLQRHPAIKLQLMMTDNIVDMVAEGIDVAIRIGSLADSTLVATRLAPNRRVLCASPQYLQQAGMPQTPQQLSTHQCLIISEQGALNSVWEFKTGAGNTRVPVSGPLTSNNGEVIRDAAIGGAGIAMKSIWDVGEDIRSGKLVTILDDFPLTATSVYAVYHNRRFVSPRVLAWIDFFKAHFGDRPYWEQGLNFSP